MCIEVENPQKFFDDLGNLHDARITRLIVMPCQTRLVLLIDDLNSAFGGLPEYAGCEPRYIVFEGVRDLEMSIEFGEKNLNIMEFSVAAAKGDSNYVVSVEFWPCGRMRACCAALRVSSASSGESLLDSPRGA